MHAECSSCVSNELNSYLLYVRELLLFEPHCYWVFVQYYTKNCYQWTISMATLYEDTGAMCSGGGGITYCL